jgi:hypothetical protein
VTAALLMTLASCAGGPPDPRAVNPTPATAPATAPAAIPATPTGSDTPPRDRLTPREIVEHPGSTLADVRVRRVGTGLEVTAWWRLTVDGRSRSAVVTSRDGFATATYDRWTDAWYQPLADGPEPPRAARLLAWRLPSLGDGDLLVHALGGDGATLFPFERVARSSDDGETWNDVEVDLGVEPQGYLNGGVALADGRLLVLVGGFSDDRPGRPSGRHHGLWASDGPDWSSYRPVGPTYDPSLRQRPGAYPAITSLQATSEGGPVIWSTTTDGLLYVSTDDGDTFTRTPAR